MINFKVESLFIWNPLAQGHAWPIILCIFSYSVCGTSYFLLQCTSILAWSSGVSTVSETWGVRISMHWFNLGECRLPTSDSEPQGAFEGRGRRSGSKMRVQGSRMLPCIISLKLTGVAQLLVETCIRKNHRKSKDLLCKWKVFTVCVILGCLIEGPMINRKEECPYIHLLAGTSDICACHDQVILFCQLKCKASRQ
jgi:hypothetical protein